MRFGWQNEKFTPLKIAIILTMGSYQNFKFLENLIKLLFFIDGKNSKIDTRHPCDVGQQKQGFQFT